MLKITLKNGKRYDALDGTAIYPSGSPNARSRMEIHMGEDAMTAAEFEAAFMDGYGKSSYIATFCAKV